MRKTIRLKKGLNLNLTGGLPTTAVSSVVIPASVAVIPDDFPGFQPKLEVAEGDSVAAGQPLLRDKTDNDVKLVTPVAGVVESIVRGARRKIERIVIRTSEANNKICFDDSHSDTESMKRLLKISGLWAMIRQRPYDIVPTDGTEPRDIFVTAMDTAPLALDPEERAATRINLLEAGVKALAMLTKGHIYIGVKAGSTLPDIQGAEVVEFTPLHPAGNAGVQAANIAPVNKGESIWTLDVATLAMIGSLVMEKSVDFSVRVALTGSELKNPKVVETVPGADIADLLKDDIKDDGQTHRIISGNVLTGIPVGLDGFLRFPYRQVTVIPEGDHADEFMGWASMNPSKLSVNPSFLGKFFGKKFNPDARLLGGRRAMIMSGVYDKYVPMDILPEYLIKAIIAKDIDQMEALGIYEVAPEDFALAEYADPSKIELQRIVREGLDYLRSEV